MSAIGWTANSFLTGGWLLVNGDCTDARHWRAQSGQDLHVLGCCYCCFSFFLPLCAQQTWLCKAGYAAFCTAVTEERPKGRGVGCLERMYKKEAGVSAVMSAYPVSNNPRGTAKYAGHVRESRSLRKYALDIRHRRLSEVKKTPWHELDNDLILPLKL